MAFLGGIFGVSKWALIGLIILALWLFGGTDFLMRNPILIVFGMLTAALMWRKK